MEEAEDKELLTDEEDENIKSYLPNAGSREVSLISQLYDEDTDFSELYIEDTSQDSQSDYDPDQFIIDEDVSLEAASELQRPTTPSNVDCRICHERDLQTERNISPCLCKGTLKMVHKSCLQKWLEESDSEHCEICGFNFKIKRIPKYNILKSFYIWYYASGSQSDRRQIAKRTMDLLLEAPVVFTTNYMWFTKADVMMEALDSVLERLIPSYDNDPVGISIMSQLLNTLFLCPLGILSGSFFTAFMFRLCEHLRRWYSWYRRQRILIIQLPESSTEQTILQINN